MRWPWRPEQGLPSPWPSETGRHGTDGCSQGWAQWDPLTVVTGPEGLVASSCTLRVYQTPLRTQTVGLHRLRTVPALTWGRAHGVGAQGPGGGQMLVDPFQGLGSRGIGYSGQGKPRERSRLSVSAEKPSSQCSQMYGHRRAMATEEGKGVGTREVHPGTGTLCTFGCPKPLGRQRQHWWYPGSAVPNSPHQRLRKRPREGICQALAPEVDRVGARGWYCSSCGYGGLGGNTHLTTDVTDGHMYEDRGFFHPF